jgi:hypothetical protein
MKSSQYLKGKGKDPAVRLFLFSLHSAEKEYILYKSVFFENL